MRKSLILLTIYKVQSTLALPINLYDEVVNYVVIPSNWLMLAIIQQGIGHV